MTEPNITLPVDLTNPGQFFACCGLLELADRLWPGAEGWFDDDVFHITCGHALVELLTVLADCIVTNTMTPAQLDRLGILSELSEAQLRAVIGGEAEKTILDGLRRKSAIVFSGALSMTISWFQDRFIRGFTLKTWAGQQSALTIASDMHAGLKHLLPEVTDSPWLTLRKVGLPFNFDSDIGGQGSGLDIGFVFNALDKNSNTRINRGCRPILELLCFIGLQRFRPLELAGGDCFRYVAWAHPFSPLVAAVAASTMLQSANERHFVFRMFNTSKDYYCFFPALPFQGDRDE